ncbi:MAG: dihydroorotate dehydrogenase electron transfer subunit [Phycisphaerae bacterium]|jgi:dihydroorotate dehydrogenase electron transfer subunit
MPHQQHTTLLGAVDARVTRATAICREHVDIELALPTFPDTDPGQFLQLRCGDETDATARAVAWPADGFPSLSSHVGPAQEAFLRRPFSIADCWRDPAGTHHLRVISRAVGTGTRWLAQLRAGDTLNLTGPLGHGFKLPDEPVPVALIGGGVGIPPLLFMARRLHDLHWPDVTAIFGATTRDLLPLHLTGDPDPQGEPRRCVELPGDAPYATIITTDDGSLGVRGRTTDALQAWAAGRGVARALVLACGPEPMLRAVADLTRRLGLDCQLCIERKMGCGLGTCLSCVVRSRAADRPDGWRWALTCTDGPVFCRDDLLDYAPAATIIE